MNKKEYIAPCLTVYGDVETLTEAVGKAPTKDSVIINGVPLPVNTDGCADIVFNT